MIAVGHTSLGVLIGIGASQAFGSSQLAAVTIAFVAGLASHYIADFIPHGHYNFVASKINKKSLLKLCLDLAVPIAVFSLLLSHDSKLLTIVLFSVLGAQLPDITEGLQDIKLIRPNNFLKKHRHLHYMVFHSKGQNLLPKNGKVLSAYDLWQAGVVCIAIVAAISI